MVIAYHLVWSLYGWWLPNDPRGSMSTSIRKDLIAQLGELHHGRKRVQPAASVLREFYDVAKSKLEHPLLQFAPTDFPIVAESFARIIEQHSYTCYACAVMPDHIHILIRKHRDLAEEMIHSLQRGSRDQLIARGVRAADHPVWGGPGWKVFIDHPEHVRRTIHYIDQNPIKARLEPQHWGFVLPYDGWPCHRALRFRR